MLCDTFNRLIDWCLTPLKSQLFQSYINYCCIVNIVLMLYDSEIADSDFTQF